MACSDRILELNGKSEETDVAYYNDAAKYWENIDPTIDGMLGGYGKISNLDLDGSNKFLKLIFKLGDDDEGEELKPPGNAKALDCGAGIGRITRNLLTRYFDSVDLVEQNKNFLNKAVEYLGNSPKVGQFFCSGLQNFNFEPETYDVIWCQWVLGHLTDDHLVDFFKRCVKGLKPNGILVVKENLTSSGQVEKDEDDSSVTRPDELFKEIFSKANLDLLLDLKQVKFPKELYTVKMYALKPKRH